MKFLVVLIGIVITSLWKRDIDRIADNWFFRLRKFLENLLAGAGNKQDGRWLITYLLTFLIPLSTVALALWLSEGLLFGMVTLLIHVFILLMAFDRIQPGLLVKEFLQHWENQDYQACHLFLAGDLGDASLVSRDKGRALPDLFGRRYVYLCFEKMFVTLFWYLLAGPLGVMVTYISYQLRDRVLADRSRPEANSVIGLIRFLDWLPRKLLAATLGLLRSVRELVGSLRQEPATEDTQLEKTVCGFVLDVLGTDQDAGEGNGAASLEVVAEGTALQSPDRLQISRAVELLGVLLRRSQYVWLTLFALITVLDPAF